MLIPKSSLCAAGTVLPRLSRLAGVCLTALLLTGCATTAPTPATPSAMEIAQCHQALETQRLAEPMLPGEVDLQRQIKKHPQNEDLWTSLLLMYIEAGQKTDAQLVYTEALKHVPHPKVLSPAGRDQLNAHKTTDACYRS